MALRPQQVAPELLHKVTNALGITALDQWYYVPHHKATKAIGSSTLNKFGGNLSSFLKYAYPQHQFEEQKLSLRNKQENDQKFVEVIIRKLFPNIEIQTKARKAVGIINPETEAYLEIDFWIPSLKLGIEYQDKHHYDYQWYAHGALEEYQKRDEVKKVNMEILGYTLVTIGYWWDKSIESVAATIRKYRPDLLLEYAHALADPIPSNPPLGLLDSPRLIPGVTGLMSPFVPTNKFDPIDWYGGEKHDGIRGVYNPNLNKMFSRSGNELSVYPSLLKDVPNLLVEGEITAGRGNYNKTAVMSYHTHHGKVNWPLFRYVLFDIPDAGLATYLERYSIITLALLTHPFVFAQSVFRVLVINKSHLKMLVGAIISDGGEGVIAQQDARYEYGRAKGLAKIKVRRDADAQVLHINNRSCTCMLVSGIFGHISFCDGFNSSNLEVGDIVSYYHNGYTQKGLPKRGEIYKVRYDVTWEQLIGDSTRTIPKRRLVNEVIGSALNGHKSARKTIGYWNKSINVRAFFDEVARAAGFDPLLPENWYSVRVTTLRNYGGGGLLNAYRNIKKALLFAYPDLKFEARKFITHSTRVGNHHWRNRANARTFLDEFARTSGFNPLVSENWYLVRQTALRNSGGGGLLSANGNDLYTALSCAYPELEFDEKKFKTFHTKGTTLFQQ